VSEQKLKVFLCHSSGDKPAARDLYRRLRSEAGYISPWLDEEDLLPGQKWKEEIPKAVRRSDVVIVCLSKGSVNKSGYIQKEIKYALDVADEQPEGKIFLIPVRLEDCEIPGRLEDLQWVNLYDDRGVERLLRSLKVCAEGLGITGIQGTAVEPYNPAQDLGGTDVSREPTMTVTIHVADSGIRLERLRLQKLVEDAQRRSGFPKQVLNIYPAPLAAGLRWEGAEDGGWSFQVNLDGLMKYQTTIAEGATFMERDSRDSLQPGEPRPGVSGLECIFAPMGAALFWQELIKNQQVEGNLEVAIDGASGRFLSFNRLDEYLTPGYSYPWNYTFWNHDTRECQVDQFRVDRKIAGGIAQEETIILAADVFAEIGFYFGFNVENSLAHPVERLRALAAEVLTKTERRS
jgi:hypothetical protein